MSLKLKINKVYRELQQTELPNDYDAQLIKCTIKIFLEENCLSTFVYSGEKQENVTDRHLLESKPLLIGQDLFMTIDLSKHELHKKDKLHFECYHFSNEKKRTYFMRNRYRKRESYF